MAALRTSFMPWRYALFLALLLTAAAIMLLFKLPWFQALLIGFNIASIGYFLAVIPVFKRDADAMRARAARNDPSAALLLLLTAIVTLVVLVAVGTEVAQKAKHDLPAILLCVITLVTAWLFSNLVYAFHYAHLYYEKRGGKDRGGMEFPGEANPDYWDFLYFSLALGMAFATSDVNITGRHIRKIATLQTAIAFGYNLGVLALSVNIAASL